MRGLMMDSQLTIRAVLDRAVAVYPEKTVVSRLHDGTVIRYTYADLFPRTVRLMNALRGLGVRPGDRVATFGWNTHRHLELYFAVPCLGAVLHTLNVRLSADELRYIVQHAEDRLIFVDTSLAPVLAQVGDLGPAVVVTMNDGGEAQNGPLRARADYEALLSDASDADNFPDLREETAAGLCYTSGTTGRPRGVLSSHRAVYLHAMGACMADSLAVSERDTVMPVVPMFHANAWGLPYACALTGANLVLPGSQLSPRPLAELIETERVTMPAGVPTLWTLLYRHLKVHAHDLSSVRCMLVGGASAPQALIDGYERDLGIPMLHAWGMTELLPVGSVCRLKRDMDQWPEENRRAQRAKQGLPVPGVEARVMGADGVETPHDGAHVGELEVRGPWVASAYYNLPEGGESFTPDRWFRTGDVVSIDEHGYIAIADRSKDVIKSRGEWISSVAMENAVMGMPGVLEASVVGRPDELRGEAPVVFVVPVPGSAPAVTPRQVVAHLYTLFAKWQVPKLSDVRTVEAIPKTSVGKFDKKAMRREL